MKKKLPISAVMVIYNEGKLLERAIKSFIEYVDELIIVHDGLCSDKSLDIARKYTDKIFIRKHKGACEYHRVFTYVQAKNEWILEVDGDEFLSPQLRNSLKSLIASDVSIYGLLWPTFTNGKQLMGAYKRALFQKSKVYFISAMHEYVKPVRNSDSVILIDHVLYNQPSYENLSRKVFFKKWLPWARLHALDLTKPFKKIKKWNCHLSHWEYTTQIRIEHPILFGMIGSSVYHVSSNLRLAIKNQSLPYLTQGIYKSLYFIVLYYLVYKLQHEKQI